MDVIVLDTSVLVYALGGPHCHQAPCRALLDAVAGGRVAATTTAEVIQEFAYVRARRRGRQDAAQHALDSIELLSPLVQVSEEHVRAGLDLWQRHPALGPFDAVLAAVAVARGATLLSADRAFGSIPGLDHLIPTSEAVVALGAQR